MDIGAIKNTLDVGGSAYVSQTTFRSQPAANVQAENMGDAADKTVSALTDEEKKKKPALEDVSQMTEAMNKFVQAINTNIRFKVHEKSNQLMVQVIDLANNTVLKEFPSEEFLDTVAAIRDYVGILLDKKI
ncbi:flagellar protein FlaG [Desulfosporosinus orientis DSM 765]|uniref:Flagellar protein FlaG n=1 Tax=Desulfosporosinus orientis (strain ATCC 19365 / DSM 765 / NCIMB 8382 / VKM B-1628 / Singapore I) TaxID=768706 RepID=G7WI04_DESOD|nr:flagellar protein FlaG [Desulfosporosinus orientis]AET70301.1 flagellar protein FlaG [Desulfosporosinus orientis DSM 765]